jgi:ribonuclease T2
MRSFTFAVLVLLGLAASQALAQRVPYRERPDGYERGYDRDFGRDSRSRNDQPGVFDYYVLALSWSPTYCASRRDNRYEPQCDRRSGRPYAFVLHGLWPQFNRGWPQHCQSADRGYVPRPVANRMLDIMPSDKLIFNEYRKHGTCTGLGVDGYFDLARRFYETVKIPERFVGLTDDRLTISPEELVADFLSANPDLKPDMIAVVCGGSGDRLREVRICFDKGGSYRACGRNEDRRKLCSADRMYVPPVRAGGGDGAEPPFRRRSPQERDILPGPRDDRRL